jgi:hypothetical protein
MQAQTLIDSYVADVTRRLPRRLRADVALELGALLGEELAARAAAAGMSVDEAMALDLLRTFGRPADVAQRYGPSPAIVDPADTRDFLIAALSGAIALLALGKVTLQNPPRDWPTIVVLSWLGFLVLAFGGLSWARRRWPAFARWRPRDPNRASRAGSLALVAIILVGVLCYGAPAWVFAKLTGGLRLMPWLAYADDFQRLRLPWLLALWCGQAVFFLWLTVEGRWRVVTRRIDAGFQVATGAVLLWFLFAGPMMRTPEVDRAAKTGLLIAAAVVIVDAAFKVRRLRGRPPTDLPGLGRFRASQDGYRPHAR